MPTLPGLGPAPKELDLGSYKSVDRHLPALAESCVAAAQGARIELLRSLRDYHPDVGKRLMIDGTDIPAWARQRAARGSDPVADLAFRKHTPDAGFRAYIRANGHKLPVQDSHSARQALRMQIAKSWRGYYKVVIADQESNGLPIVLSVFDAATDEAPSLVPLLSDLHRLWPDIEAADIAGDSAWDEDWACRVCEVDYGIHPIFRLHDTGGTRKLGPEHSRDLSVGAIAADGQLVCSAHGSLLRHAGLDRPSRAGMNPGDSTPEGKFRIRAECRDGCGKLGLKASTDWSLLCHYPHHRDGRPELNAYREARLNTLGDIESCFQRFKSGRKLGTEALTAPAYATSGWSPRCASWRRSASWP